MLCLFCQLLTRVVNAHQWQYAEHFSYPEVETLDKLGLCNSLLDRNLAFEKEYLFYFLIY